MIIMKQKTSSLIQYLTAALLVAATLLQSCSKKTDGPGPGPVDNEPKETETLKLIPDSLFRVYLKANVCPNAFDKSGKLIDITHSEVKNFAGTISLDTFNCPRPFVSSVKGIEYFTKMTKLIIKNSAVDSLSLKATMALDTIKLVINKDLQYVDVSGCTNMRFFRASDIPVVSLDLSNLPLLDYVNLISLKRMSELKLTNSTNLRHLMTYGLISMKSFDVSGNPELRRLYLESASLITTIDVTHNPKLYGLVSTWSGNLRSVDLSNNPELSFVMFDDSRIDTIDFSHNPKLISVAMLRTPLRNLDFRANPDLKLLYLDGCYALSTVDLRAQSSFDYYSIDFGKYGQMGQDDANMIFQHGFISVVPTAQHTIHAQATRKDVNGATTNLFGGLRLPIFQDAGGVSLTNALMNDATKDNYSLVMSRRVLSGMVPVRVTVYAQDQTTVLCADYDPLLFKCN